MEHIWTILMLKILHSRLLRTFVANSEIDAIYALYPESLSDKYLAVRKVFAFSDSVTTTMSWATTTNIYHCVHYHYTSRGSQLVPAHLTRATV